MKANRIELNARAIKVSFPDDDSFSADLADGRTVTIPLAWFPRLLKAKSEQRRNVKISALGQILHWPRGTAETWPSIILLSIVA